MLGASRAGARSGEVTLPALRPAIAAAAAIVFLFTFTSFGVILILGGPRVSTLETEIYRQTAQLLNLPLAAALTDRAARRRSSLLLVVTGRIEGRRRVALRLRSARETARRPRTARRRVSLVGANLALMAVAARRADRWCSSSGRSHPPGGYGFDFYRALGDVHAGQHAVRAAGRRDRATRSRFAAIATVHRGGRRRAARRSRWPRRAGRGARRRSLSLPLGVSAVTRRLRLPHRARPRRRSTSATSSLLVPDRAGARRDPVRRAHR